MNESKPTYTVAYGEGENKKGEESYDTFKEAKMAYLSAVGDNLGQIVVLYEHLDGETSVLRYHDENDRKKEKEPFDKERLGEGCQLLDEMYDEAIIGITTGGEAVYDYDLMVECLMEADGLDFMEAQDTMNHNISFGVSGVVIVMR